MVVGSLYLALRLTGCRSLKDKRRALRGLMERVRRSLHVAIAEVGDHDLWSRAEIGVSCVSTDPGHAESILQHVIDDFDGCSDLEVVEAIKQFSRN